MSAPATITSNGKTFKKVQGENSLRFIRPAQLAEDGVTGEILEGIYLGPVKSQIDATKNDYKFETGTETVIINSSGSLAYQLKTVAAGSLVKVFYNGMEKMKSGRMAGKSAHSFEVLVAND